VAIEPGNHPSQKYAEAALDRFARWFAANLLSVPPGPETDLHERSEPGNKTDRRSDQLSGTEKRLLTQRARHSGHRSSWQEAPALAA
jgi:hypothetical protein